MRAMLNWLEGPGEACLLIFLCSKEHVRFSARNHFAAGYKGGRMRRPWQLMDEENKQDVRTGSLPVTAAGGGCQKAATYRIAIKKLTLQ